MERQVLTLRDDTFMMMGTSWLLFVVLVRGGRSCHVVTRRFINGL